jgi:hypothetical protein
LKKLGILGLAGAAMLALPGAAVAQLPDLVITPTASVSPNKAGTKKKPKNGTLRVGFTVNPESRRTVDRITLYFPKNMKIDGKGFKTCSVEKLNTDLSGADCPKGSKIGEGTAGALLGPAVNPITFKTELYAAGRNKIALFLIGQGIDVQVAFPGPIKKSTDKRFGQQADIDIPPQVQSPALNLFSYITNVDTTIGGSAKVKVGKKKVKRSFGTLNGCPKGGLPVGIQLRYVQNDVGGPGISDIATTTASCRK